MSEEKRKNVRLQGRYSDEHRSSCKEKQKRLSDGYIKDSCSNNSYDKQKNSNSKLFLPAESVEFVYDKHANIPFPELEEKIKPTQINETGKYILSSTQNGESRVIFEPDFIPKEEAAELMTILESSTKWYDKNIIIHGQEVPQPRLVAWYGPFPYQYSGAVLEKAEIPPTIQSLKRRVESCLEKYNLNVELNSVLLNLYRNEKDSVAWHSDDEISLGINPTIASVSLGEVRKFQMKAKPHVSKSDKNLVCEYFINLTPGSLVIMDGCMQNDWKHQVPKEYHARTSRINLTFRTVFPIDRLPAEMPSTISNKISSSIAEKNNKINLKKKHFPPKIFNDSQSKLELEICTEMRASSTNISLPLDNSSKPSNNVKYNAPFNVREKSLSEHDSFPMADNKKTIEASVVALSDPQNGQFPSEVLSKEKESEENLNYFEISEDDSAENSAGFDNVYHCNDYDQRGYEYQLNAEASEFVPKTRISNERKESNFDQLPISKLADRFLNDEVPYSQFDQFFKMLFVKIDDNQNLFLDRDFYELDTLYQLNDGSQNEKNQRIIMNRICSLIQNAVRKTRRNTFNNHHGLQQGKSDYRDNNNRFRGSSRGSNYRGKGLRH